MADKKCMKCKDSATLILRKKDSYCDSCFLNSTNHKFRACLGKNKVLSANQRVLVCLSGGMGSTVLLNLIYNGIYHMDSHKKLRIVPLFLHLLEKNSVADNVQAMNIIEHCKSLNFEVHLSSVSEYLGTNNILSAMNCIPEIDTNKEDEFSDILKSMPASATNDFLQKVKRRLFIRFAKLLDCNFLFTAETTTSLAINLLSSLALGRGSQVENDIGFCDTRDDSVKILRPMKDISKEELNYYINIKKLTASNHNYLQKNSLQSVIETFVIDLQESYQATISTVCRTADKISVYENGAREKCHFCESCLDPVNVKLTALEATKFSRTVSKGDGAAKNLEIDYNEDNLFPYINKYYCYGCSRISSEMGKNAESSNSINKYLSS